jgi:hypothetical protein
MVKSNSKITLIDFCLRSLGAPVIEINVDEDQIDDRIDEALQFYQNYHMDGIEKVFLKHQITNSELVFQAVTTGTFIEGEIMTGGTSGAIATVKKVPTTSTLRYNTLGNPNVPFQASETVTGGTSGATGVISSSNGIVKGNIENRFIPIPNLVQNVVRVIPIRDSVSTSDMFDIRYQIHMNDLYSLGFMGSLAEYVMSMQYLDMLDNIIDSDEKTINFDMHKNQLDIFMNWSQEVQVDDYIVVECFRILDPDTYTDVYNDYFLKKYATSLIKRQWGTNLLKFEGMQMPGGVTFNGRQLFDDANEEITRLEEEARLNWEQPVDFYVG